MIRCLKQVRGLVVINYQLLSPKGRDFKDPKARRSDGCRLLHASVRCLESGKPLGRLHRFRPDDVTGGQRPSHGSGAVRPRAGRCVAVDQPDYTRTETLCGAGRRLPNFCKASRIQLPLSINVGKRPRNSASDSDSAKLISPQCPPGLSRRASSSSMCRRAANLIVFRGTAQTVQSAFRTLIHRYLLDGVPHIANSGPPSLPAAMAPLVSGINGLDDFQPKASGPRGVRPQISSVDGSHHLGPGDYAAIYDILPLYQAGFNGSDERIAVIGRCSIGLSDVQAFRTFF
jgi:hypothetical protein